MTSRPFFHATPRPFIDESRFSWILRTCASHACSLRWFERHFKLTENCDFDLDLSEQDWDQILQVTGFAADWRANIDYVRALRMHGMWENYRLKHRFRSHRWCASCLSEDKIPYYRRSWRFGSSRCTTHGGLLKSVCSACSRQIAPDKALRARMLNLAFCPHCGYWLGSDADSAGSRTSTLKFMSAYVAETRPEFQQRLRAVKGTEAFLREYRQDWLTRPTSRKEFSHSLALTAAQFSQPSWEWPMGVESTDLKVRGSWQRMRLAAALTLVRRELRASATAEQRLESGADPTPGGAL